MKKFAEWRASIEENMNATALRNTLGGGTVSVDPILRSKLREKILQITKEFPEKNPAELFQEIMAVVGSLLTKGSGTTASATKMHNQLNQQQAQQTQQMQNNNQ